MKRVRLVLFMQRHECSIISTMVVLNRIEQQLSFYQKTHIAPDGLTSSAVLIPIYEVADEGYVIFTKRTQLVDSHKGQICFPGGRCHDGEAACATALRESWEEIGLHPEDARIVGELDDSITLFTNYLVTPFVAEIPFPYEFEVNTAEVEEVITVPVSVLLDDSNYTETIQIYRDEAYLACTYQYQGYIIWGATARILKQMLDFLAKE
ncbi:MAG: CoA pyrophosphatase [Chloroflexota bacterium]|nr:CoA pyrophosphatase [Chloroflexota bacterium]